MKSIFILIFSVIIISSIKINTYAQEKVDKKHTETMFEVKGVCKMCKERIEEAAIYTKGVKFAEWNKETQKIKVLYRHDKVSEEKIHQNIAKSGHTTEKIKASEETYAQLPACCKYLEVEVH